MQLSETSETMHISWQIIPEILETLPLIWHGSPAECPNEPKILTICEPKTEIFSHTLR